ncbi:MAG TPA: hypothetical protein VEA39_00855 [Methylophilaceae bacterium]|nr:hypothetical protein [Methylophilaceae bacterium]
MSEQKHTQEPWIVTGSERVKYVEARVGGGMLQEIASCMIVEHGNHEANARRIVACVNACAGIGTLELERVRIVELPNPPYHELKQQRDELLNMLKRTQDSLSHISLHSECPWACGRIDEAFEEIEVLVNKVESK